MAQFTKLYEDSEGFYMMTSGQAIVVNLLENSKAKKTAQWTERPNTNRMESDR